MSFKDSVNYIKIYKNIFNFIAVVWGTGKGEGKKGRGKQPSKITKMYYFKNITN